MRQLVIASNNAHKLAEMRQILGPPWQILSANDCVPGITWDETGTTFLDNARLKIAAIKDRLVTSDKRVWILADDSGLCVEALQGAPGVASSHYGGIEGDHHRNLNALLHSLLPYQSRAQRAAYFFCLIVVVDHHGTEHQFEGRCHGQIALTPEGQRGFGYDPVFIPDGFSQSFATMDAATKNKLSHRGQALAAFKYAMMDLD